MLFKNKKAQGSLEFLLIIGGAVLIAVIVIALLIGMGGQSRDSAQDQTTKAQKVIGIAQPPIITSIHIYNISDCTTDGCPDPSFQGKLNSFGGSCSDANPAQIDGLLKLTWNQLSSGGEYILKIYNYADQEVGVNICTESSPVCAGDGVITDINPVYVYMMAGVYNGVVTNCEDTYWAEIINVKDGQTVKSTRMSFNW